MNYPIVIVKLSKRDGGGYAGYVPDLPGCMSDGETPEEAVKNTKDAIIEWIDAAKKLGRKVPKAGSAMAQAVKERKVLVNSAKLAWTALEDLKGLVEQLSNDVREIQDRQDNEAAWSRFSNLTNIVPPAKKPKRIHVS